MFALPPIPNDTRDWNGIVIHHSASPDGITRDADGIAKYHTSYRIDYNIVTEEEYNRRLLIGDGKVFEKPWKAVGYNFLIERVGKDIKLIPGRPLSWVGAHAGWKTDNYYNENYIGICVIGNYDIVPPEDDKWNFIIDVIKSLMFCYEIHTTNILGHRETYQRFNVPPQKTCPGTAFDMEKLRGLL
jgi:N-acetyl-anhydromuramyl-L-alanine amidase AmpD